MEEKDCLEECQTTHREDNKCDGIEIISRPGFWHWVKHRENWKKTNVVYEVKFNENN